MPLPSRYRSLVTTLRWSVIRSACGTTTAATRSTQICADSVRARFFLTEAIRCPDGFETPLDETLTLWASLTAPQVWGVASHHAVLAEASHATDGASDARALPARLRPLGLVRSRIALFVRCLPPSLPRRRACLGRSFIQTAERDLSTLAHGLFARAIAGSDPLANWV